MGLATQNVTSTNLFFKNQARRCKTDANTSILPVHTVHKRGGGDYGAVLRIRTTFDRIRILNKKGIPVILNSTSKFFFLIIRPPPRPPTTSTRPPTPTTRPPTPTTRPPTTRLPTPHHPPSSSSSLLILVLLLLLLLLLLVLLLLLFQNLLVLF